MTALTVGSIIRLGSLDAKGEKGDFGFLYTLEWVTNIPVITLFHDPLIRTLVTTYSDATLSTDAAAPDQWQILSADAKKPGQQLHNGDLVYLLNMRPGAGYLDTFEWVPRLEPFKNYPMTIGVFTASVPNRGGGVSGTWKIYGSPNSSDEDKPIDIDQPVYFTNEYPGAGYLFTHGGVQGNSYERDGKKIFQDPAYEKAKKFVFTGQLDQNGKDGASCAWKITPVVASVKNLYRIEQQWGSDVNAPWHDAGIFQIGDEQSGRLVSLTLSLAATSLPGGNKAQFKLENTIQEYNVTIKRKHPDQSSANYNVRMTSLDGQTSDDQEWILDQSLEFLQLNDNNGVLQGSIQYAGEQPISIKALQGSSKDKDSELLYDFLHPDILGRRAQKMQGIIDTTYGLIADTLKKFDAITAEKHGNIDVAFQKRQLANLKALNETLNAFYKHKITYLMRSLFKNHRADQTLAPLHLVRQSFQEVVTDYEIIQQATIQRQWIFGKKAENGIFMSAQALELMRMDKLAMAAIAPFMGLLPSNATQGDQNQPDNNAVVVISYLSEETHIRHVPYTDRVILLGVSYDSVPQEASLFDDKTVFDRPFHAYELMAIPHEIGHYIYRHGMVDNRTFPEIAKQFEGNNPYYLWCEELFADLYGCMVTGPLTVLSMRALLVSIDRERAWNDDDMHPTPVLRMFILNEVLRILKDISPKNYAFSNMVNKLDEDWAKIVESWGYGPVQQANASGSKRPSRVYLHTTAAIHLEQIVNVDRVINAIRPIIVEFATLLHNYLQKSNPNHQIPWVASDTDQNDVYTIFDECDKTMKGKTSREFAASSAPYDGYFSSDTIDTNKPDILEPNTNKLSLPDELLQYYLLRWGDKGPLASGGGTHG